MAHSSAVPDRDPREPQPLPPGDDGPLDQSPRPEDQRDLVGIVDKDLLRLPQRFVPGPEDSHPAQVGPPTETVEIQPPLPCPPARLPNGCRHPCRGCGQFPSAGSSTASTPRMARTTAAQHTRCEPPPPPPREAEALRRRLAALGEQQAAQAAALGAIVAQLGAPPAECGGCQRLAADLLGLRQELAEVRYELAALRAARPPSASGLPVTCATQTEPPPLPRSPSRRSAEPPPAEFVSVNSTGSAGSIRSSPAPSQDDGGISVEDFHTVMESSSPTELETSVREGGASLHVSPDSAAASLLPSISPSLPPTTPPPPSHTWSGWSGTLLKSPEQIQQRLYRLKVLVVGGAIKPRHGGVVDPVVYLHLGDQSLHTTGKSGTLQPAWNELLEFVLPHADTLHVELMDEDAMGCACLGRAEVELELRYLLELLRAPQQRVVTLHSAGEPVAQLTLTLQTARPGASAAEGEGGASSPTTFSATSVSI
eukprot:EG_transcript_8469